jgi:hypothetical protein
MDRRNFLQLTAGFLGTMLFRQVTNEDTTSKDSDRSMPLCLCPVAGFQHHQPPAFLDRIKSGQALTLRREPKNPHDQQAIAVYTACGAKLGYLPRRLNAIPANLMDSGRRVVAEVMEVNRLAAPWEAVEMMVGVAG